MEVFSAASPSGYSFLLFEWEDIETRNPAKLVEIGGQDGVAGGQRRRRDDQIVRTDELTAAT